MTRYVVAVEGVKDEHLARYIEVGAIIMPEDQNQIPGVWMYAFDDPTKIIATAKDFQRSENGEISLDIEYLDNEGSEATQAMIAAGDIPADCWRYYLTDIVTRQDSDVLVVLQGTLRAVSYQGINEIPLPGAVIIDPDTLPEGVTLERGSAE